MPLPPGLMGTLSQATTVCYLQLITRFPSVLREVMQDTMPTFPGWKQDQQPKEQSSSSVPSIITGPVMG